MKFGDRLLEAVRKNPGQSDRELTDALKGPGSHPSQVNQESRLLEQRGLVVRRPRSVDGVLATYPPEYQLAAATDPTPIIERTDDQLSEDELKESLELWLESDGWSCQIAWGRLRGADIVASRGESRWIVEVKGIGSLDAMRVNYFIGILGELLQRMDDDAARYSVALPDVQQFRRLWERLPPLAKHRTQISALFVGPDGSVVEIDGPES